MFKTIILAMTLVSQVAFAEDMQLSQKEYNSEVATVTSQPCPPHTTVALLEDGTNPGRAKGKGEGEATAKNDSIFNRFPSSEEDGGDGGEAFAIVASISGDPFGRPCR